MNPRTKQFIRFATLSVGLGFLSTQAFAQQGKFNLPVTAHWGKVTLEPGKHTVRTPVPIGATYVYLENDKSTGVALPLTTTTHAPTGKSFVRLKQVDGEYYVDEYQSGAAGKLFTFAVPKSKHGDRNEQAQATYLSVGGE